MYEQKLKEQIKAYETQQKQLQAAKKSGKSAKQAEEDLKSKMAAKQNKQTKPKKGAASMGDESMLFSHKRLAHSLDDAPPPELVKKAKEYLVKFKFPSPPKLAPPVLGLKSIFFSKFLIKLFRREISIWQ